MLGLRCQVSGVGRGVRSGKNGRDLNRSGQPARATKRDLSRQQSCALLRSACSFFPTCPSPAGAPQALAV